MVKFINRHTGNEMWVDESRVSEYEAKGHKRAVSVFKPVEVKKPAPKKPASKKKR